MVVIQPVSLGPGAPEADRSPQEEARDLGRASEWLLGLDRDGVDGGVQALQPGCDFCLDGRDVL